MKSGTRRDPRVDALRKQTALISLLVGLFMLVLKGSAYLLTGSSAILSDALESVIHVAATGMAFYSVIVSSRPPDSSHPYGHGKVEFFSAGIEGGLIALAALAILYEAIGSIVSGKVLQQLDAGVILILGASAVNLFLGLFLIRRGHRTGSLTLVADGRHVLTDAYTSFGVVAGLLLVRFTGIALFDPIVAIIVAINIIVTGYRLVRVSVGGLMDESDRDTLNATVSLIREQRSAEWISVHNLRILRSGELHHIDFHLTIPFYWSVEQGHRLEASISDGITRAMNGQASVMIHLDPCTPLYCQLCHVEPCLERKEPVRIDLKWNVARLTGREPVLDFEEPAEDSPSM
ncbi:MAG: cation diffusion facilitator family transporter [Ignavibacteria bacterium]|nr:cation diffusion facilitator family transporter [Ignavibacteria bacterium]